MYGQACHITIKGNASSRKSLPAPPCKQATDHPHLLRYSLAATYFRGALVEFFSRNSLNTLCSSSIVSPAMCFSRTGVQSARTTCNGAQGVKAWWVWLLVGLTSAARRCG